MLLFPRPFLVLPVVLVEVALAGLLRSPSKVTRVTPGEESSALATSSLLKTHSNASVAMIMHEEDVLFTFLKAAKVQKWEDFKPKCMDHVDEMMTSIDKSYTDEQLETVLRNECIHSKEFPNAIETGFAKEETCKKFAKQLAEAREEELYSDSERGYEEFCWDYYVYRGGLEKEKKAEPPPVPGVSIPFVVLTILGCVAFVLIAYLVLRQY